MADNVQITEGSGRSVKTEDDGSGNQVQVVKATWGVAHTITDIAAGASALPIQDGGNSITVDGTVGVAGTVTVDGTGGTFPVTGTVTANPAVPTTLRYGQSAVAVTNTAVQLSGQAVSQVIVQALAANAGNVVVGDASVTTANGFQLQPGQATGIAIDNVNRLYVNGTSGDGVCWIGS